MNPILVVARHTFKECLRRKVFVVVPIATVAFLGLYALGIHFAFRTVGETTQVGSLLLDERALVGSSLLGLSMFVTLFFGAALGIFLTFGVVRGDAEQGLLQPLVVRPVARTGLLAGRLAGAAFICISYVLFLYLASVLITGAMGSWWPDPLLEPGLHLAAGVVIVISLSLLGSVFLSAITNGIASFMVYGAGLMAGLLAQIGEALSSPALETTGRVASWLLPFEALYQSGLNSLTSNATGLTRVIVNLGPLGGAQAGGGWLWTWSALYLALVSGGALWFFKRRDL